MTCTREASSTKTIETDVVESRRGLGVSLVTYLLAFVFIVGLNFVLPRLMPGDPLMAIYGEDALVQMTPEMKDSLVERFALDQPLYTQFVRYVTGLLRGDLGYSYYYKAPVSQVVLGALPWTLLLAGSAFIISTFFGIVLGIESGWRRGSLTDGILLSSVMVLGGLPSFFIGVILLILFAVYFGIAPLSGALTPYADLGGVDLLADLARHLALPVVALSLVHLTGSYLIVRNSMVGVLGQDYIRTAKAKGLRDVAIRYRHAGRNSLLPALTVAGIQIGRLMTGVLFIEIVFAYPGMGYLIYNSLIARDYPVLQGAFLAVAACVLLSNYLTDRLYEKVDPRVRTCMSTTSNG